MKFQFKIQEYQTEAVEDTVNVFRGQPMRDPKHYRRDMGVQHAKGMSLQLFDEEAGYRNTDVELTSQQLLANIREMRVRNQIVPSTTLASGHGVVNLDIEMETGTGKPYDSNGEKTLPKPCRVHRKSLYLQNFRGSSRFRHRWETTLPTGR